MKAGLVRILWPDDTTAGTGFVISEEGLIATCSHVVQDERSQLRGDPRPEYVELIFLTTGERRRARVDPEWWRGAKAEDVAILRLDGALPAGVHPLPLGSSADARGHTFHTFGFPQAIEGIEGKCEVIGKTTYQGFPVLQLRSSEITQGFSGAPMWDDDLGVVVGMVSCITRPDHNKRLFETAFVIPVETLRAICSILRLPEGCPYRGLSVFEAEHADLYFGREAAARELLQALTEHDVVLLEGVSGSGKSSLVRAGLEKALRAYPVPGLTERLRCLAVPGRHPMFNLVLALADRPALGPNQVARAFSIPLKALIEEGKLRRETAESLDGIPPQRISKVLVSLAPPEGMLLVVDQFERLYTECPEEEIRNRFIETLLEAAGEEVKILLALRADFYGMALAHPKLSRVAKEGRVTLLQMEKKELRTSIEEPARRMKRVFQPGLVERIIADVRGRAGNLPLLEFALTELWERDNQKGILTLATYESLGYETPDGKRFPGVQGAIAHQAEAVWKNLNKVERHAARRIFLSLVVPGPVDERGVRLAEDASRRAWKWEWDETTKRVAQKLVDARLLVTGRDPVSGKPTVEVAHESLIRAWPRLQRWLRNSRNFLRWYQEKLAPFLRRWLSENQHHDFLLPEAVVNEAKSWLERYPDLLNGPAEQYIRVSIMWQENLHRLSEARRMAVQAQAVFDNSGLGLMQSALLAIESARRFPLKSVADMLRCILQLLPPSLTLIQHNSPVRIVTCDSTGTWAASGSEDGKVLLWEVKSGRIVAQMKHQSQMWRLAFSPDGHWLVTSSRDGTTIFWDIVALSHGEDLASCEIVRLPHGGTVWEIAFNPTGDLLMTASQDGLARVWDIYQLLNLHSTRGVEILSVSHDGPAALCRFSPDGHYLITGGDDGTIRVWEISSGEERFRLQHDGPIYAGDVSPTGRWIASGGEDGTTRIWDISTGEEIVRLIHHGEVWTVNFSPSGQLLATSGEEGIVRIWELPSGKETVFMEHEAAVNAVRFWPDGRFLVSCSSDATARLWNTDTGAERTRILHKRAVTSFAIDFDNHRLITGSIDGSACVWSLASVMTETHIPEKSYFQWSKEVSIEAEPSAQVDLLIREICARLPRNLSFIEWRRYLGDFPYHPTCPNLPVPEP